MDVDVWTFFEERIAELVLEKDLSFSAAVGQICRDHDDKSAELLLLGAISFLSQLDVSVGLPDVDAVAKSHQRYRALAALAADIALLAPTKRSCLALYSFWESTNSEVFR